MYGYNAEPPIAIPIYTVLPYCVMVFGIVHPYIFIHLMEMFFILVSLVFNIHCIHVCVDILVRKRSFGKCVVQPPQRSILRPREGVYNGLF